MQCLQAAQTTSEVNVGTSIAIAFARTPMTLALTGYDLARYSKGRFILGIGSQIKAHIVLRYSMPWSHPAPRMREFIQAMRAIWATWQDGVPLDFQGEFYKHILMTPFFSPEPHEYGPPPVYLAGVGELMTEVAGEVADGFFVHPFTTRALPRRGHPSGAAPRPGEGRARSLDDFTVCAPAFVTTGRTDEEMAAAITGTKKQIAFYASTPAYRGGARASRLGRRAARAHPAVQAGRVGRDGRPDRRRHAEHLLGGRPARGDRADAARQARRHRAAGELLRQRMTPTPPC